MENNPLVSVAIPAYKCEFLADAIESVLNQTYKNIELYIVNDCSPQDIDSIVERYKADSRLHYYKNDKNIGRDDPVANWNKCLSYAKGEFFSLLCDDDIYEPTFIEEMVALANKYEGCNVFRARVKIIGTKSNIIDYYPTSPKWESCVDYIWHKVAAYRLQTISEFMLRRQYIIDNYKGYTPTPKAWCADEISIFRFSEFGGIASSPKVLVGFRKSGINISTHDNKYVKQKIESHNICTYWIERILNKINVDNDLKRLILKKREDLSRNLKTQQLSLATLKDFIYIYIHKNDSRYSIPIKCFIKAIEQKIILTIKSK